MKLAGEKSAMQNRELTVEMRTSRWRRISWLMSLAMMCVALQAQTPPTTTVSDTVFRADGTPAAGTLLISWPAFTTANGDAIAGGTKSVTLGSGGALSVALVPNIGATPANTVYTVVYQLSDGTVKTEYWVVPTSSPATLAGIRTTLGSGGAATSLASKQYVDTSVSNKASDAAVVHKSGSETITGVKEFSTAPSVPTPVQATDAVNKEYVDTALAGVGSGAFVSKSGDVMTGPLQLSSDPTASNQAANRHYVDAGLAGKANLASGVVPPAELGSGTTDNTTCLKGNSTWGACGSSSDAISIQSVPVDTVAPSDNQVITYDATSGKYKPKAGGGVTAGMQAVKYAVDFSWSQSPTADLSTPGAKTVTLSACPAGVKASEPQYYVYISGTGTFEAVQVTGGTCSGNGASGTLQFTTLNAHPAGYTISSASGGLQEALIAARYVPTNPTGTSQAGKVIVPPGEFKVFGRVSIRASNVTVDFSGSIVECQLVDTCIFVGDPSNSILFTDITLISPRGRPTIANGQAPFIEVNAQKTRLFNVATRVALSGGTFGTMVQVDDDQAFLLDGLSTSLGGTGVRCDATVCNPVIYAPGPFNTFSAVGWLKNLNLSLSCAGNGVDWQSGNTLRISDSVIQGYAQYGVRAGTRRGGFGGFSLDNVYEEVGNCTNPLGNIGEAGVIAQGSGTTGVRIQGGAGPAGKVPLFANTGTTDYRYYIVAHHATLGSSNPLYAGNALTNGSGDITVTTPDIAGANSFDLLRVGVVSGTRNQAPFGTGNYAVATAVSRTSACTNGVCTFTDTQAALQSYTVALPAYFPMLDFWPAALVLGANSDSSSPSAPAVAYLGNAFDSIVSVLGTVAPSVVANRCGPSDKWTPTWLSCYSADVPSFFHEQGSFLLMAKPNADGGGQLNLKGRLNFASLGTGPGHIMTLSDANFQKTIATSNNRPTNDANDAFIGYDQANGDPAQVGISFGAPKSLSNYIGNVGNGSSWLERLTSTLKEFKTNVQMDSGLTLAGSVQTTGPWTLEGAFGTMTAAGANKSKLGFGASGKLQVSENGGSVFEVAKLDVNGNVSNANTSTQLASTPIQCNGSFATGIQANGNANCSTPDIIQLAETTPPTGISNFGIFWFDTTCHCPKVISNNGQAIQLGLVNLFNPDSNTLEERNGANRQFFNLYGNYNSSTDFERLGISYDTVSGNYLLKGEAGSSGGSVHGIALGTGSSVRWRLSPLSPFWFGPDADNAYDLGDATHRVRTGYFQTSIVLAGTTLSAVQGTGSKVQLSTGTTTNGHVVTYDSNGNAADSGTALASLPTTGTLVSGNMVKASGSGAIADAGVAAGPYPSKWWTFPSGTSAASFSASSGKATVFGVHIDYWWTFSKINYKVVAADTAGATYDLGLADRTGAIVCHIGNTTAATNFTGTGAHQLNLVSSCSGPPGDYYATITCSATSGCATLTATSANAITNITNTDVTVSSAGTLSNFTAPADAWSWTATAPIFGFQ